MQTHEILKKFMDKKRAGQQGYSVRALARDLELSPSFLSRVFNGEKPVPYALLLKLGDLLDIDAEVLSSLKSSYQPNKAPKTIEVEAPAHDWDLADKPAFSVLRHWFYLPILDATSLENFDGDLSKLANRMGLAKETVEVAVREMIAAGLLSEKLTKTRRRLRWASKNRLDEIRKFHDQMLEKAQAQLRHAKDEEDFKRRLITGVTVTASPEAVERAKQKLAQCMHEIAEDLMNEPGTDVYQLAVQLFPLTKASTE